MIWEELQKRKNYRTTLGLHEKYVDMDFVLGLAFLLDDSRWISLGQTNIDGGNLMVSLGKNAPLPSGKIRI